MCGNERVILEHLFRNVSTYSQVSLVPSIKTGRKLVAFIPQSAPSS